MEDEKIVEEYLNRNEAAVKDTADKYGARLRSLSYSIVADHMTAEECENDTYMEAWNRIPPNKPVTYFYAFLACITRHISIDRCRKRSVLKRKGYIVELSKELELCLPSSDDVESVLNEKLLGEAIGRFLRTLPREKRIIFMRRYFYLDSVSDIARHCSISESKVKTTLFRTRNNLRIYLVKEGYTV